VSDNQPQDHDSTSVTRLSLYAEALQKHDETVGAPKEVKNNFPQRVADGLGKYVTVIPAAESAEGLAFFERIPRWEIIDLVDGSLLYAFGEASALDDDDAS
jgi:hypothetical protein